MSSPPPPPRSLCELPDELLLVICEFLLGSSLSPDTQQVFLQLQYQRQQQQQQQQQHEQQSLSLRYLSVVNLGATCRHLRLFVRRMAAANTVCHVLNSEQFRKIYLKAESSQLAHMVVEKIVGSPRKGKDDVIIGLEALAHVVRDVELSGVEIGPFFGAVLNQCPKLRALALNQSKSTLTPTNMAFLEKIPLKFLHLRDCKMDPAFLDFLSSRVTLTSLSLERTFLSESSLLQIRHFVNLKELSLAQCHSTSTELLRGLATEIHHLELLNLTGAQKITNTGLEAICTANRRLRFLLLSNCVLLSDSGLEVLPGLPALEFLDLTYCQGLTSAGVVQSISMCQRLKFIDLGSVVKISDDALQAMIFRPAFQQHLEVLHLTNCTRLTDAAFKDIHLLQKLRHLDLSYLANLTGEVCKELRKIKALRKLLIYSCSGIDDSAIAGFTSKRLEIARSLW